jgi:hypothetical protein
MDNIVRKDYIYEVKKAWTYTSTSQYVFMAWHLVKNRDNIIFYIYPGVLSPGVKRPEREADKSPPTSAEAIPPLPNTSSWHGALYLTF